jgi:hypothetical protein
VIFVIWVGFLLSAMGVRDSVPVAVLKTDGWFREKSKSVQTG